MLLFIRVETALFMIFRLLSNLRHSLTRFTSAVNKLVRRNRDKCKVHTPYRVNLVQNSQASACLGNLLAHGFRCGTPDCSPLAY